MAMGTTEDFIKSTRKFSLQHLEHKNHLTTLSTCLEEVTKGARALHVERDNPLPFILKVQAQTLLEILDDLNSSLVASLSKGFYSSVEALSRVALENTINLIYIFEDDEVLRAKSLLNSYLTTSKKRAEKWLDYAVNVKDVEGEQRARTFIQHLKDNIKTFLSPFRKDPKIKGWPDARARFKAVGLENLYHILYAPSCNSVHSFSEDIYNFTYAEYTPPVVRAEIFNGMMAEKTSFAYYLATNAVLLYSEAIQRLAVRFENEEIEKDVFGEKQKLWRLITEHENLTDDYYKDHSALPV